MKAKLLTILVILSLTFLAACITVQVPEVVTPPADQQIITSTPTPPPTETPLPSPTPLPTETPLPSPTPLPPTATFTSVPPTATSEPQLMTVSAILELNANCRFGPGTSYAVLRYLLRGTEATVLGRTASQTWWLVQEALDRQPCWITASAATIQGDVALVPLMQIGMVGAGGGSSGSSSTGDSSNERPSRGGNGTQPTSRPPATTQPPYPPPGTTEPPYPPPSTTEPPPPSTTEPPPATTQPPYP